jgi:hypothetical protein
VKPLCANMLHPKLVRTIRRKRPTKFFGIDI